MRRWSKLSIEIKLYLVILALSALAQAFSGDILSNYFKEAYLVTPYQRGLIEFPRELPGLLCTFIVALLAIFSDIRIAIIAQVLAFFGITVLGLSTPTFSVMLLFIFINSVGGHLFMPVQDTIAMNLVNREHLGKRMGQFKGVTTAFLMFGGLLVFISFRLGLFSLTTPLKLPFLIAAGFLLASIIVFLILDRRVRNSKVRHEKVRFVFRKEYRLYYVLVIMFGVQKQIMLVYGPWVLIEILSKRADTLALLGMTGAFLGIFFIPALGRALDKFGIRALLFADALSFIGVYLLYALAVGGYESGALATTGWPVLIAYAIFVIDRMSTQMGIIRTVYLRKIAVDPADITATISMGISMDHVVSILCAWAGGLVWSIWGAKYVFYLAAALSLVNLWVAFKVKNPEAPKND